MSSGKVWVEIWNWANSVFLFGGEDRNPERIWSLILAENWAEVKGPGELLGGFGPRLGIIQDRITATRKEIAPLLASLASSPLSEWDALVLPQIHLEPAFLTEKLELMLSYNELVEAWRNDARFEMEELCEIHQWGKKRVVKFGLREIDLPFPGCWEYGLLGADN
jgi:hypothetical protein